LYDLFERKGVEIIEAEYFPDHFYIFIEDTDKIQYIEGNGLFKI